MRLAQDPRQRLRRKPVAVLRQPEQTRTEQVDEGLAGKVLVDQLQDRQRKSHRRGLHRRPATPLAEGNAEPMQRGADLLGDPISQAPGCDRDAVRRRSPADQRRATPGDLARLRRGRGAFEQRDGRGCRWTFRREQPAEKRQKRRAFGRVEQRQLRGGLRELLDGPQYRIERLRQLRPPRRPGQANPDAQPCRKGGSEAQPKWRPVEDALELDLRRPGQLGGQRAAALEMFDRQPQRLVRIHQRGPIERRPRGDQRAPQGGRPLGNVERGELDRLEQPLRQGRQKVAEGAGISGMVADAEVRSRRVLAGRLPQRELERERRGNLGAGSGALRFADQLASELGKAVRDPAGNETALAREAPQPLLDARRVGQDRNPRPAPAGLGEAELGCA